MAFEVPAADDGPRLSSLCLLRRADRLPADAAPSADPFRYEATRLVPHLGGPVSQAANPNLSFFARLCPCPGGAAPALTLDFVRDGRIVGRAQPAVPAPDASGRIAYVGGVPWGLPARGLRGASHSRAGRREGDRLDALRPRALRRRGTPR